MENVWYLARFLSPVEVALPPPDREPVEAIEGQGRPAMQIESRKAAPRDGLSVAMKYRKSQRSPTTGFISSSAVSARLTNSAR